MPVSMQADDLLQACTSMTCAGLSNSRRYSPNNGEICLDKPESTWDTPLLIITLNKIFENFLKGQIFLT